MRSPSEKGPDPADQEKKRTKGEENFVFSLFEKKYKVTRLKEEVRRNKGARL